MTIVVQRPQTLDVTKSNPNLILYIKGDETTDGSIRYVFTAGDAFAHIETRNNGVWNDTGLRISSSTLNLGRDMRLSAISGFLETVNPSNTIGHQRSFIPHIEFNDVNTLEVHAPIASPPENHVVYSTAVGEIAATTIGIQLGVSPARMVSESIHEVGSVAATADVRVSFYDGTDNTGFEFNRKVLPASDFVPGSTLIIDYGEDLGFDLNIAKFMEFTSPAIFSLKTDAGGNPLTRHTGHEIREIGMISDLYMLDEDLHFMFDETLNPMYSEQFP